MGVSCFRYSVHSSGTIVGISPIAAGQIGIRHSGARVWRMDKLSVPGINTHMRNAAAGIAAEENHVTGLKIDFCYICTLVILGYRRTVRGKTDLLQNVIHKTGAVKSAGRGTACHIRST